MAGMKEHWSEMKSKASENISHLTEKKAPGCEEDIKHDLAYVLRHGSSNDAAEAIFEACEWAIAYHMCKASEPIV